MKLLKCYKCNTAPVLKCRKCLLKLCEAHAKLAQYGTDIIPGICGQCNADYVRWIQKDAYTPPVRRCLICMLSPECICRDCLAETCLKHRHLKTRLIITCPTIKYWMTHDSKQKTY